MLLNSRDVELTENEIVKLLGPKVEAFRDFATGDLSRSPATGNESEKSDTPRTFFHLDKFKLFPFSNQTTNHLSKNKPPNNGKAKQHRVVLLLCDCAE
jgi:hypothetical protein